MRKTADLLIVSLLIIISLGVWVLFSLKPLMGFFLFACIPLAYLSLRGALPWKKILFGSIVLGLFLGTFFDLIQSFNRAWIVNLVIPWKVLGVLPIDNILGYFFMTLLVLSFYEYFFDPQTTLAPRFYKASLLILAIVLAVLIVFFVKSEWFILPYSYLIGGIAAALVTIAGLMRHSELLDSVLRMTAYFFIVWFLVELSALRTGGWSFAGQYLGWVQVFGVGFPFEEMFFWMLWYTPFLIIMYSYLMRDKNEI